MCNSPQKSLGSCILLVVLLVQSFTDIFGLVPANFQIPTKLCTDLPKGMNKRFSVGDIFFTLGKTQEGHAHLTVGKF